MYFLTITLNVIIFELLNSVNGSALGYGELLEEIKLD